MRLSDAMGGEGLDTQITAGNLPPRPSGTPPIAHTSQQRENGWEDWWLVAGVAGDEGCEVDGEEGEEYHSHCAE